MTPLHFSQFSMTMVYRDRAWLFLSRLVPRSERSEIFSPIPILRQFHSASSICAFFLDAQCTCRSL